jgi:type II secretory pathway pseudopilin PulG
MGATDTPLKGLPCRESGFTLLELVICLVVMMTFMGATGALIVSSSNTVAQITALSSMESSALKTIERVVWELRFVPRDWIELDKPQDAGAVTFATVERWEGGTPIPGDPQRLAWSAGSIVLNDVVIARGVKGLVFNWDGTTLEARVDVEKPVSVSGEKHLLVVSQEVHIVL